MNVNRYNICLYCGIHQHASDTYEFLSETSFRQITTLLQCMRKQRGLWVIDGTVWILNFQKENSIALLLKKTNWSEMWWVEWIVYSRKLKHFSEFLSSFMMCMQNIFRKMGREFTRRLSLNMFFNHDSELVLCIKCFLLLNIVSQKNAFHFKAKLIPFSHWFGTIWRNKRN